LPTPETLLSQANCDERKLAWGRLLMMLTPDLLPMPTLHFEGAVDDGTLYSLF
jgi:hypothetical protein